MRTLTGSESAVDLRMGRRPSRQPRDLSKVSASSSWAATVSDEVREAVVKVVGLIDRLAAATAAVSEAEARLPVAEREDREAMAAGILAGRPRKVITTSEDQAREALGNAIRERDALQLAADSASADLERLIEDDRPRWQAALKDKLALDVSGAQAALDAVASAFGVIAEDVAVSRWLTGFPRAAKGYRVLAIPAAADAVTALGSTLRDLVTPEPEVGVREDSRTLGPIHEESVEA